MEIDYKQVLTGLLSKAYKFDNGKLDELLSAEGATPETIEASLLEADAQRVATLKTISADSKEGFNQGYAKAKKEEREKFENELKSEFGLDSTTTGLDLVKEIVTAKSANNQGAGEITEDAVKRHSVFLQMERGLKEQITNLTTEHANKLTEIEATNRKNETFQTVKQKATDFLASLKPIESKNPTVATTLKNTFLDAFRAYDFEPQADGSFLVLKDGKRYDDNHGHAVNFDEIVKSIAGNYYEFEANTGGNNAGNQNQQQNNPNPARTFKTQDEADKFAADSTIPLNERIAAMEAFTGTQKTSNEDNNF